MRPRVLLIDSYDSYTCNLEKLVERVIQGSVVTIRNDSIDSTKLVQALSLFDAVIVGPGPGTAENPNDVGILNALWSLNDENLVPVLGVCLGFQSLAYNFSGKIKRLNKVKHGQPSKIKHEMTGLFEGIPNSFSSIRYNSLRVVAAENSPFRITAYANDDDDDDDVVPMAGQHLKKPFYGVQFHPESICSEFGDRLIENFWNLAQNWSKSHGRLRNENDQYLKRLLQYSSIIPSPMLQENDGMNLIEEKSPCWEKIDYSLDTFPITNLCESLDDEFILLHSARDPGRWSIIGCLLKKSTQIIKHFANPSSADVIHYGLWGTDETKEQPIKHGLWKELTNYMETSIQKYKKTCQAIDEEIPFTGGLIGYFSYEEGYSTMPHSDILEEKEFQRAPDTCLADCTESIVIDNLKKQIYVISLKAGDEWVRSIAKTVMLTVKENKPITTTKSPVIDHLDLPDKNSYLEKIRKCQELLHNGESYELCLTAQTTITLKEPIRSWDLYKTLLRRNPAPYSIFMDFKDSTLIGASPERFMNWSRDGTCQFRPIKGTVRKSSGMTKELAERILHSEKERGENLMIVDLIRHDLNMILQNVQVDLMKTEEYETVYQLVSVISGELHGNYRGIDVLCHSLPPGSMTGAPKIRSVQLLRDLEDHKPRGIYSGVAGYWSVTDEGDWSVVIRSAMNYGDDLKWQIGAGGAITVLSDETEEWDEMYTKLESALKSFENEQ